MTPECVLQTKIQTALPMKKGKAEYPNFMTPHILGFVPCKKGYSFEISYGKGMGEYWMIGVTLYHNGKLENTNLRREWSVCFEELEINKIPDHIKKFEESLK